MQHDIEVSPPAFLRLLLGTELNIVHYPKSNTFGDMNFGLMTFGPVTDRHTDSGDLVHIAPSWCTSSPYTVVVVYNVP